jgi:hypothetical protein
MKKTQKILIMLLVLLMAFALCACSAPAVQVQNEDGSLTVAGVLIEQTVNSLAKLVQMAFFALAAFAADKLGKNLKLKNLNIAVQKVCEIARQTAGELQQTIVADLKAENPGGKLTPEQIDDLGFRLLNLVKLKLDDASKELIIASGADLDALITGECESYLNMMKNSTPIINLGPVEVPDGGEPETTDGEAE